MKAEGEVSLEGLKPSLSSYMMMLLAVPVIAGPISFYLYGLEGVRVGVVSGLILGAILGIGWGGLAVLGVGLTTALTASLLIYHIGVLTGNLEPSLSQNLAASLTWALTAGILGSFSNSFDDVIEGRPVGHLRWGTCEGAVAGIVAGFACVLSTGGPHPLTANLVLSVLIGLVAAVAACLAGGLLFFLFRAVLGSGLMLDFRRSVGGGIAGGVAGGLVAGLGIGLRGTFSWGITEIAVFGLLLGAVWGFLRGFGWGLPMRFPEAMRGGLLRGLLMGVAVTVLLILRTAIKEGFASGSILNPTSFLWIGILTVTITLGISVVSSPALWLRPRFFEDRG